VCGRARPQAPPAASWAESARRRFAAMPRRMRRCVSLMIGPVERWGSGSPPQRHAAAGPARRRARTGEDRRPARAHPGVAAARRTPDRPEGMPPRQGRSAVDTRDSILGTRSALAPVQFRLRHDAESRSAPSRQVAKTRTRCPHCQPSVPWSPLCCGGHSRPPFCPSD
jgi:hypothetical protein